LKFVEYKAKIRLQKALTPVHKGGCMSVAYSESRIGVITLPNKQVYALSLFIAYVLALLQCRIPEFSALNRSNPARLEFKDFGGQSFRISCINKIEILVGRRSKNRKSDLLRVLRLSSRAKRQRRFLLRYRGTLGAHLAISSAYLNIRLI
jgi:hypothetical protein